MPVRETEFTCEFLSFVDSWRAGQWFYEAAIGLDQRSSLRDLCDFCISWVILYTIFKYSEIEYHVTFAANLKGSSLNHERRRSQTNKKKESLLAISLRHKLPPYDFYTQTKWVTVTSRWRGDVVVLADCRELCEFLSFKSGIPASRRLKVLCVYFKLFSFMSTASQSSLKATLCSNDCN